MGGWPDLGGLSYVLVMEVFIERNSIRESYLGFSLAKRLISSVLVIFFIAIVLMMINMMI